MKNMTDMEYIKRDIYLQKLIDSRLNGDVKVVTGPRRCGKSWLLTRLYKDYLISDGVPEDDIIIVSLDLDDETNQSELADKDKLKAYLYGKMTDPSRTYYVILDEIQEVEGFEKLVNGLRNKDNVDVYVTGSNAKLLSKEISTIFRDRGQEIRCNPFSFKEFCTGRTESLRELWQEYYTYGGMPGLRRRKTKLQKAAYLQDLWNKTYITDIKDRYTIENEPALEALADGLCSSIGALSNPTKMANSLRSIRNIKIDEETVKKYLDYVCDSFLFEGSQRYDIKGKEYYKSFKKYYCVDVGLRNARLNFRQQEITHIMENIIYNELRARDYLVDVGMVASREMRDGKSEYIQYEVDFIATNGIDKYYIQSAYALPTEEKREQELKSLKKISDSFLFEGSQRYDIKGKEYYKSFKKYYCVDVGLRNARLNFRQQEITHIMENIIYNELRARDYMVDVGMVASREMRDGKSEYIQYEVDFIATNGIDKYYIQSAYALPTEEKREQEFKSLKKISDSFQKIVIVGDDIASYTNEDGIIIMGLFQFLMNTDILK